MGDHFYVAWGEGEKEVYNKTENVNDENKRGKRRRGDRWYGRSKKKEKRKESKDMRNEMSEVRKGNIKSKLWKK